MPVIDHFGIIAPMYDRMGGESALTAGFRSLFNLPCDGVLLDVGGGTGRMAAVLRPFVGKVVVTDISKQMLERCAVKPGLMTVNCPAEELPFLEGTIDRVLMVDAFHHVESQERTARELWRVLRPGGTLLIEEPDNRLWWVKMAGGVEKLMLMRSRFMDPEAIARLFPEEAQIKISSKGGTAWIVVQKRSLTK
jgi:demethylmenaquinone methyltransferase/2-methoxy-6-polyprenyl-1,4-benzoquinol methylase